MPAFTFEKIAPPVHTAPAASHSPVISKNAAPRNPRGLIVAMLDRLTRARLRRERIDTPPPLYRKPPDKM